MKRIATRAVPVIAVLGFLAGKAAAVIVSFSPVQDATLYEDPAGTQSSGASTFLMAGRVGANDTSPLRRSLLQFSLSTIPAGAAINSVQLTLQLTKLKNSNPVVTTLQRVTSAWTEGLTNAGTGGNGAAANVGDATWLHRASPTTWANPGGDFLGTASSTLNVADLGSYTLSGAGMAADVQFWLVNPAQNFGWMLRGDESTAQSIKEFGSRQGAVVPQLVINYTPVPEASSAALVLATLGLAVRRRRHV